MNVPPITERIADYAIADRAARPDARALELARMVLLDDLGCMLLGSTMPAGRLMREHVTSLVPGGDGTIVGRPERAPAPLAALANGLANHAVELDGTHITEGHPSAIISPACLAMAEHVSASGLDLARAMILAYDVGTRLVRAMGGRLTTITERHLHSDLAHVVGATAAAGQLLGLDSLQLRYAFALAAHQVNMPGAFFSEPDHHTKALNCGQGAYAAVSGALLAQRGFTANSTILEDEHGLLRAWSANPRWDAALDGLGEHAAILDSNFKLYAVGYPIHAPVAAILRLMSETGIHAADIDGIEVHMTTNSAQLVDDREMKNISLQDMVALAVVTGGLDHSTVDAFEQHPDPTVAALRSRVSVVRDAELDHANPDGRGAWVQVTLTDGRRLREDQPYPPLHSRAGDLGWDVLEHKFRGLAATVLAPPTVEDAVAAVRGLAELPDVHVLTKAVRP
jgi:2-methylcitrate dehydratase PrpD